MLKTDTIVAISTSYGNSGIGIIRTSGDQALNICNIIWSADATNYKTHTLHYGKVIDKNIVIDEALFVFMKGPNSYTGEDVVEIQCHGGMYVLKRIVQLIMNQGARIAEPGEFTKRAFLNGKIDLIQAEAVMDIINSSNEFAMKTSISQLEGTFGEKIREFRKIILYHTAFIENALDDPEHIDLDGYSDTLKIAINSIIKSINIIINSWENGHILKEGINVVILGEPNVGKSSLMNAILDKDRVIVSNVPGTTRDTIDEIFCLNGVVLHIVDTAGIRQTNDKIEQIGVERSIKEAKNADLILYVIDSTKSIKSLNENINFIKDILNNKKVILVLNKIDLMTNINIDNKYCKFPVVCISSRTKENLNNLTNLIKEMFIKDEILDNDQIVITNIRHKNLLIMALTSLNKVINSIDNKMPEDFYSIDLMEAYEKLGKIIGETTDDNLINEIFSKFCVGK